jgi:hypothetical protein
MKTKNRKANLRRTKNQQRASGSRIAPPTDTRLPTSHLALNFDSEGFFFVLNFEDAGASTYGTGKFQPSDGVPYIIEKWTRLNTVSVAIPFVCIGPGVAPETRDFVLELCDAVQAAGMGLSLISARPRPDSDPAWEVSTRYAALCVLRDYLEHAAVTRLALAYCE